MLDVSSAPVWCFVKVAYSWHCNKVSTFIWENEILLYSNFFLELDISQLWGPSFRLTFLFLKCSSLEWRILRWETQWQSCWAAFRENAYFSKQSLFAHFTVFHSDCQQFHKRFYKQMEAVKSTYFLTDAVFDLPHLNKCGSTLSYINSHNNISVHVLMYNEQINMWIPSLRQLRGRPCLSGELICAAAAASQVFSAGI